MEQRYINYFLKQHGDGIGDIGETYKSKKIYQSGFGATPITLQQGHGLGSFLQSLFHLMKPLVYSGVDAIKSEVSTAGKNILQDIARKPITELITEHGEKAISNLTGKAKQAYKNMRGKGVKGKRINNKKSLLKIKKTKLKRQIVKKVKNKTKQKIVRKKPIRKATRPKKLHSSLKLARRTFKKTNKTRNKKLEPRVLDIFD